jgi:hypothetical protein
LSRDVAQQQQATKFHCSFEYPFKGDATSSSRLETLRTMLHVAAAEVHMPPQPRAEDGDHQQVSEA